MIGLETQMFTEQGLQAVELCLRAALKVQMAKFSPNQSVHFIKR